MANEENQILQTIVRINKDYSGLEFEKPYVKILDRHIDITEEKFVEYMNKTFQNTGPEGSKIIMRDIDEKGNRICVCYMLEKDLFINPDIDNCYYLLNGTMDIQGSFIPSEEMPIKNCGFLKVYNPSSSPPRFVFLVKQDDADIISLYITSMMTKLDLSEPAYAILKKEDENNEEIVPPVEPLEKEYQKLIYAYLHRYSGIEDIVTFLENYNIDHGVYVSQFRFQRILLPRAEEMGLITKSNPKKKKSRWIWKGAPPN